MPHSEIPGSKLVRSSPGLIAAYHVLHRLLAPRHPPNALITLDCSHDPYAPPQGSTHTSYQTTHAIKPAHAALHTDYSAVVRMIRTSKTMVADASQHPHLMLQRARSIPQSVVKTPAKTLAGLLRDLPVRVIILFTMSNNPKRPMPRSQGDHKQRTRETCCSSTNTFLSSLNRRQARPRLWLFRAWARAASRPCGACAPGRPTTNGYADRDLKRRRLAPTERKNAAVAALARTRAAPHGADSLSGRTSAPAPEAPSKWWSQTGSNRRPPECKSGALPAELWPHLRKAKMILYASLKRRRAHPRP